MKRRKRKHTGPTQKKKQKLPMVSNSVFTPRDGRHWAFTNNKATRGVSNAWGITEKK